MEKPVDKYAKRVDEPTPAGGTYHIAHFRDADGCPCTEDQAVHFEIIEYDENDVEIMRTYA